MESPVPPRASCWGGIQWDAVENVFLDLFGGMGGLQAALNGGPVQVGPSTIIVVFETDAFCRALHVQRRSPGVFLSDEVGADKKAGSVLALVSEDCRRLRELRSLAPRLRHVQVCAGSPCQGFSVAGRGRGGDDPRSALIWTVMAVIATAHEMFAGTHVSVAYLLENVASMPDAQRDAISQVLGVQPQKVDAATVTPGTRERLFWASSGHVDIQPAEVPPFTVLEPGWCPAWEILSDARSGQVTRKFRTLLTPFGPGSPPECPLEFSRLPLSTYDERGLVFLPRGSPAALDRARRFVESAMRINTRDLKVKDSPVVLARTELVDWIHRRGGKEVLRPLSADERDRVLGFPPGWSRLQPSDEFTADDVDFHRLHVTGNAFAPPVVRQILGPVVEAIAARRPPPDVAPRLHPRSTSEWLVALRPNGRGAGPGAGRPRQG